MNIFLQYAIKHDKIRDYDEAVVPEEHVDCTLFREYYEGYNDYKIGDLVFVQKYKYKNGKLGFYHIFLIVDRCMYNQKTLYYGMIISSKVEKISYSTNRLIEKDNQNNLRKNSIIKTDVIYKLFTENILLKIGNIDKNKVESYKNYLMENV